MKFSLARCTAGSHHRHTRPCLQNTSADEMSVRNFAIRSCARPDRSVRGSCWSAPGSGDPPTRAVRPPFSRGDRYMVSSNHPPISRHEFRLPQKRLTFLQLVSNDVELLAAVKPRRDRAAETRLYFNPSAEAKQWRTRSIVGDRRSIFPKIFSEIDRILINDPAEFRRERLLRRLHHGLRA